jgi:hypothetical protein
MKPKLCKAGQQLREQIDDAFPGRDRTSDGWIGDTRHAARKSDHNPDVQGWVRAIDVDRDLAGKGRKPDVMPDLVDQIRLLAKSGDKRISYIIFDGKIASSKKAWAWRPYDGINKHNHHAHVSFTIKGDEDSSWFNIPMIGGK